MIEREIVYRFFAKRGHYLIVSSQNGGIIYHKLAKKVACLVPFSTKKGLFM